MTDLKPERIVRCGPRVTAMLLAHADRPKHDMTLYADDYWDGLDEECRERYRHLERVARNAIEGAHGCRCDECDNGLSVARIMRLDEFLNGIRVLWNIDADEYLACINVEDREYYGDGPLWEAFRDRPHRTFVGLPTQDQERVFAVIEKRNARMKEGKA